MKALTVAASALLLMPRAFAADFSVSAVTDFMSDVKASIAAHDKNGDGMLDRGELGDRSWMLLAMDRDKDGKLTEDEMKRGMGRLSRNLFPSKVVPPSTELAPPLAVDEAGGRTSAAPKAVRGADFRVGRLVPDLELTPAGGGNMTLSRLAGEKGMVVAVLSATCPVSKKYLPSLARLEKEFANKGVKFVGVPAPGEDAKEIASAVRAAGMKMPVIEPGAQSLALLRALGASHTTDVFAIDAARTLVYRGAVDDQYGLGYNREAPREKLLVPAIEAMLVDRAPLISATIAPGCEIELPANRPAAPAGAAEPITWHNRISRIVRANCASCHRAEGVAPFAFDTYAQFVKKAGTIRRVVSEGAMPPWFSPAPASGQHTQWLNDASLRPEDKADLLAWLAGDRPEGDSRDASRPLAWPEGWSIGKPDMVVQIPQPVAVKAEGTMPYQSIMVETKLTEDRWVSAWEIRPTAREVVHHVLVYSYIPGTLGAPGAEERRGQLAGYAPGSTMGIYPDGFAKLLPKGAILRFEIHYTPNGKATQDQTMVGLRFAPRPPEHVVEVTGVANVQFAIPPGAVNHAEAAAFEVPADARILSLTPHMHMRGKAMRFEAIARDGSVRTLLDIPRYDFNWQIPSLYAEPPLLPGGTQIRVTGWFDNSAGNPANPDPSATVRWGSQTNDEMMIGYVEYYRVAKPAQP